MHDVKKKMCFLGCGGMRFKQYSILSFVRSLLFPSENPMFKDRNCSWKLYAIVEFDRYPSSAMDVIVFVRQFHDVGEITECHRWSENGNVKFEMYPQKSDLNMKCLLIFRDIELYFVYVHIVSAST